jgi:hypothetical protein
MRVLVKVGVYEERDLGFHAVNLEQRRPFDLAGEHFCAAHIHAQERGQAVQRPHVYI